MLPVVLANSSAFFFTHSGATRLSTPRSYRGTGGPSTSPRSLSWLYLDFGGDFFLVVALVFLVPPGADAVHQNCESWDEHHESEEFFVTEVHQLTALMKTRVNARTAAKSTTRMMSAKGIVMLELTQ